MKTLQGRVDFKYEGLWKQKLAFMYLKPFEIQSWTPVWFSRTLTFRTYCFFLLLCEKQKLCYFIPCSFTLYDAPDYHIPKTQPSNAPDNLVVQFSSSPIDYLRGRGLDQWVRKLSCNLQFWEYHWNPGNRYHWSWIDLVEPSLFLHSGSL